MEMQRTATTGWRAPGPAVSHAELRKAEKASLYEAQRLAVKVLNLTAGARHVLEQLVGFYKGEPIAGRMLVWPSNELLEDRTGLAERTIRYAFKELIETGVIASKDSANGKRYARKSRAGQIIDAFGFDLSPLLERMDEWRQRHGALVDYQREQKAKREETTVLRRTCQGWLIEAPDEALEAEYGRLARSIPRRSSAQPVSPALDAWREFHARVEAHYNAACAGKDCRQKDHNNDTPDQSCYNGREDVGVEAAAAIELEFSDVLRGCPDALAFVAPVRTPKEMMEAAARYRGLVGVSADAWGKACADIGILAAAVTFMLVLQRHTKPVKGIPPIANPGGYFRAMTRMVKDGTVDLATEIHKFKSRR